MWNSVNSVSAAALAILFVVTGCDDVDTKEDQRTNTVSQAVAQNEVEFTLVDFKHSGSSKQNNLEVTARFSLKNQSNHDLCFDADNRENTSVLAFRQLNDARLEDTKPQPGQKYAAWLSTQSLSKKSLTVVVKPKSQVQLAGILGNDMFDIYRLANGLPDGFFDPAHTLYITGFLEVNDCVSDDGQINLGTDKGYLETEPSTPFTFED